jgi:hypothetical protein
MGFNEEEQTIGKPVGLVFFSSCTQVVLKIRQFASIVKGRKKG